VQPLFEHRLEFAGFDTRVLELEGDGPGLVLLHGWGDSADTWRPLLAELGARDRRAIAVDLPGFGTASRLHDGPMLPQLDAFAAEVVRELGEDVVVVGNSLGGVTALRLAERDDLPLAGVVPVAPAGLQMPRWFDVIERDPLTRRLLGLPLPIAPPVLRATVGEIYRQLVFARPRSAEAAVVAAFANHHASRERVAALLASGRRLLPELQTSPFRFERVRCPVLLIWGTRDRMVPHTGAQILLEALPHTHLELLEGVGHCPQLEATGRLLDLLLPFPAAVPA
jgi:pimeloyl-ACP methyl ester carboxylesterase